jgi:hypothetical protein
MHRQRQVVRRQVVKVHQNLVLHLVHLDVVLVDFDKELVRHFYLVQFLVHLDDLFSDQASVVALQNQVLLNLDVALLMDRVVAVAHYFQIVVFQKFQMDYFLVWLQVLVDVEFHRKFQMDYFLV